VIQDGEILCSLPIHCGAISIERAMGLVRELGETIEQADAMARARILAAEFGACGPGDVIRSPAQGKMHDDMELFFDRVVLPSGMCFFEHGGVIYGVTESCYGDLIPLDLGKTFDQWAAGWRRVDDEEEAADA